MSIKKRLLLSNIVLLIVPLIFIRSLVVNIIAIVSAEPELSSLVSLPSDVTTLTYTMLIVFFIVALNFILTYFLIKSIVKPLNILGFAAKQIKEGNLDFKINYEPKDEFGVVMEELEELRQKMKAQIELNIKYEYEQKQLLASVTHDLKTPITSIKGYALGLLDGVANTPEKQEKYIRTIYDKAEYINKLTDELYQTSKYDLKREYLKFEPTLLEAYLAKFFEDAKQKYQLINNSPDAYVAIDTAETQRVLQNILDNSIKYRSQKELEISVEINNNLDYIIIKISDNGIGIGKDEENLVFERFYRNDSARRSGDGSGLGLFISKQIIQAQNGRIWARNRAEGGTSIYISLPMVNKEKYEENIDN